MPELFLLYRDENHTERRTAVGGESFTVGRHSMNDLHIPDSRLSREHLRIERFGGTYSVADLGSSNGTTLNGYELTGTRDLNNGDRLDLGGGIQMTVELISDDEPELVQQATVPPVPPAATDAVSTTSETGGRRIPTIVFLILPAIAFFCVLIFGTALYLMNGSGTKVARVDDTTENENTGSDDDDDVPVVEGDKTPGPGSSPGSSPDNSNYTNADSTPSTPVSEFAKAEEHGSAFMRAVAHNEPRAFLTAEHATVVGQRIKRIGGSSALAANIESARKNAAQITSLAAANNIRPQLLAAAAIARLGDRSGDVGQTAVKMAEVFAALNLQIGSERADDAILMVAAYDQGLAGDTMKLRNILQKLAVDNNSVSSRTVRTIWFVKQAGKLTDAEYDFAVRTLAVGTIMQNPAAFNVKAEALVF